MSFVFGFAYDNGIEVHTPKPEAKIYLDSEYDGDTNILPMGFNYDTIKGIQPIQYKPRIFLTGSISNNSYSINTMIRWNKPFMFGIEYYQILITDVSIDEYIGKRDRLYANGWMFRIENEIFNSYNFHYNIGLGWAFLYWQLKNGSITSSNESGIINLGATLNVPIFDYLSINLAIQTYYLFESNDPFVIKIYGGIGLSLSL